MKCLVIFLVFSLIVFMAEPAEGGKIFNTIQMVKKALKGLKGKSMYSGPHSEFITFV